ncbi:hypothetical protein F-liban_76 [Faustovirus]|nr:hypothetical protein F-liban_76 [Faustovirus]
MERDAEQSKHVAEQRALGRRPWGHVEPDNHEVIKK